MPEFIPIASDPARPVHVPVLLREVLQQLQLSPGLIVVDGTVGAGGHSKEIVQRIQPGGQLIGLDRDARMLEIAARQISSVSSVHQLHQASYAELARVLAGLQIPAVDRVLLDLGLSSDQLADKSRGFSFAADGPLDLRFDTRQGESAADWLARVDEPELADILDRYGEERHSRPLARALVAARHRAPIRTARDLAEAVIQATSPGHHAGRKTPETSGKHPATRVFQALRIVVNRELEQLETMLGGVLFDSLKPGGIAGIITFHSLEDRLVKQAFREPKLWQLLTPKPIPASPAEQRFNPRSRTAQLRVAKRL
ncbi:MAG: 16S rRNA (cytosine(1402)-N(4))-methyltransferase RsmH [Planctomycetes bacterium]|nr:16S rRNA (cytosine(1402)-N(4))-methyltransferase RsmH [Planctomycetota bacterium]